MTTASKITLARVVMIPVFMVFLLLNWNWAALAVFVIASLTDSVDGYIARHYNQVSDFGKFLDPLADKLLVISAMVIFVQWGRMPAWMTASTMVGLCVMMAISHPVLDLVICWIIVVTTLASGVEYFIENWDVLGLRKS